jgi:hypothetical protein
MVKQLKKQKMKKKNLLMTAVAILCFATISIAQTVPSYVPTSGLVGWWPFTGNAIDSSGNGNNGTVSGPTPTTDRYGANNSAYSFFGCNEIHANVNTASITIGMTLSFWFYRNTTGCLGPRLMEFNPVNNTPGQLIIEENYPAGVRLSEYTSGGFNPSGWLNFSNLVNQTWSHYVYTNDGIFQKLYQNGILINTYNSPGNSILNGDVAYGRMNHPAYDGIDGKLDDIGLWNRALTQAEITDLYTSSSVGINEVSQSNLFSVYPNPAKSQINVKADAKLLGSIYTVYNNTGKLVLSGKIISENTTIELGNLSGGIYLFSVGENLKQTFKVIKE